ncbi:MAG TPA: glycoside hydrolase family 3 N-terminal domain-containing protein [Mycobacteriales bacterium]|nr:glycoside hydrolase family 3 N-terminal domain-containing protein [Mycobacteriales bacterium]
MPTDDHGDGNLATTGTSLAPTPSGEPNGEPPRNGDRPRWQDRTVAAEERVTDLLARMTLAEKIGQLRGVWVNAGGGDGVAPHQHDFSEEQGFDWAEMISAGLGQLTRPFGTAPVTPDAGAHALARAQTEIIAASRFGIPALAHEECLTGFMTWGATIYPTPLAWAATFDPTLVERMAGQIGAAMRGVGVHQGLAPVLDVSRDHRWGRTEETLGEDPYLVATLGTAYVRGLQASGVIATLKHFAGYSGSRAGRNFGPVGVGPRELADVLLPPFEMAVRDGEARSAMASYAEVDGMPATADPRLLTELLRGSWGFRGTVVADYFAVSFLESQHQVGGNQAEAAALALTAGVDVELPAARCYAEPLLAAIRAGLVPESLVDRAARRVLVQKCELGLLDPGWNPTPPALAATSGRSGQSAAVGVTMDGVDDAGLSVALLHGAPVGIDLDPPANRQLAREIAEHAVVLLSNTGTLPLPADAAIALVGPQADDPMGMLGCYTFPSHVGSQHPELPLGVPIPTVLAALRAELPAARIEHVPGCTVDGADRSGFGPAVAAARRADVCVAVLGDRSGLFGRGTVGEGSDVTDLRLPGVQADLLTDLLGAGTPVVLVLLTGRPYALGGWAGRLAAVVQAFFPGEEGGPAVAGVLSGRVNPSGRLPVSMPRETGGQPASYLAPLLGRQTEVSSVDPTALFPFGHGRSYTTFEWADPQAAGRPVSPAETVEVGTDGTVSVSVAVTNTGDRAGTDVVQLYLHDPVAQVTRPVMRLIGYSQVRLQPGETRRVGFGVHADLTSFTGRDGRRVVEPGELELRLAASSVDVREVVRVRLTGPERVVDHRRQLVAPATVR